MQKLKTELEQHSSHAIALSKGTFLPENTIFFPEKMLISA